MKNMKIFEKFEDKNGFLKKTEPLSINSEQKSHLNRKGNMLINSGDIETAKRIFLTTGYSDGLVRIGNYYKKHNRIFDALHMYWTAPDKNKSGEIIIQISQIVHKLLEEDKKHSNDEYNQ